MHKKNKKKRSVTRRNKKKRKIKSRLSAMSLRISEIFLKCSCQQAAQISPRVRASKRHLGNRSGYPRGDRMEGRHPRYQEVQNYPVPRLGSRRWQISRVALCLRRGQGAGSHALPRSTIEIRCRMSTCTMPQCHGIVRNVDDTMYKC